MIKGWLKMRESRFNDKGREQKKNERRENEKGSEESEKERNG